MKLNDTEVTSLLKKGGAFGFTLITILLSVAEDPDSVFEEEPSALFLDLEERFNVKLSLEDENRINACLTAMTTDLFYTNPNVFRSVALALSTGDIGRIPDGDDEELGTVDCLWAIVEVGLLEDLSFNGVQEKLSDSVVNLVNDVVDNEAEDVEGQLEGGDDVDTVEEAMAEPYYRRYVTANLLELARQLIRIGVSRDDVAGLLSMNGRSVDEVDLGIDS